MGTLALTFDLRRIADNGGVPLSVTGLLVVFAGLALVTAFIAWLPALLDRWDRIRPGRAPHPPPAGDPADDEDAMLERERAVAIATVLDHVLTPEDGSAVQRITIRRSGSESLWRDAHRIRSLTVPAPPRNETR